jgi:hypothetical protein
MLRAPARPATSGTTPRSLTRRSFHPHPGLLPDA